MQRAKEMRATRPKTNTTSYTGKRIIQEHHTNVGMSDEKTTQNKRKKKQMNDRIKVK